MNRRYFLCLSLAAVAMPALARRRKRRSRVLSSHHLHTEERSQPNQRKYRPRVLSFHHLHTEERIRATYHTGSYYQFDELRRLNNFMRDFRTGDVAFLDPKLFDLLYDLDRHLGYAGGPIEILSAYRSPRTNAMLRKTSRRVARNSLHMEGKALDIRFPGVSTRRVRDSALSLGRGGVGFYPSSNFVHIDTGSVRYWKA